MSSTAQPRLTRRRLRRELALHASEAGSDGRIEIDLDAAVHYKMRYEKTTMALKSAQAKLSAQALAHESAIACAFKERRRSHRNKYEALDAEINARARRVKQLEKERAKMDEMQHNINALRKRLASHMSDGLAKNVAEARERRDQLMKQKESLEDQVQRLQKRVDKVDNSKKSLLAKSDHLDALASREETLRELIRRMRVKLSLKMPNSAIERRQIHMKSSATTVYLHEPAPPGFPEVEEVSAKTRKPLPVPGELAPGEELTASWRSDLAEPLIELRTTIEQAMAAYFWIKEATRCEMCTLPCESVFISTRSGLTACRNCVRENGAAFGPHFEDPNFDSISSRLEMNGAFEAAMDAVLKMLREDMASIQHDSITRVRTRFSMYTKLLGMQTAQKMPVSPAKVAALRVGTIWRERARRGSLQRLQDALETSRQQEQTQKGEGEKEKQ